MAYVVDLHIHSRFSRACSPALNVPNLAEWAKLKGINLLGTGDFLHPLWLTELKSMLTEDGSGFLSYKDSSIKFLLTVEVSSIYSHKGKVRRVHNLIFLPSFEAASKLQQTLLSKKATLASDGRPIVGISSKDLLSLCLSVDEKALFVPGHAWTPWFGIFGSESGYDCLKDCFEDLTDKVLAVETGLSSDPAMNWRIKELDGRSILSFSDAHSLPNLGREVTVFNEDVSNGYMGLWKAIKEQRIAGTLEFYPEEGKYHYTGHRNCNIKYSPDQTKQKGTVCPVCGKGLTVGVMERVEEIASRSSDELQVMSDESGIIRSKTQPHRAGYRMLVPLLQIISEALNSTPTSQKVMNEYKKLTESLGGEIKILTKAEIKDIAAVAGGKVAEGVEKAKKGDLVIDPGYDGVYGVVKIWQDVKETKIEVGKSQMSLFE